MAVYRHNKFKLPFFIVCAVLSGALAIDGIFVALNLGVLGLSLISVVVILSRQHPWWLRSKFDRE
jgi:hypothetical protein